MEPHLQHEEQAILRTLVQQHQEHVRLCITIGREHGELRTQAEAINPRTARDGLAAFGCLLRDHTLLEDRELFPLVERHFSPTQMAPIVDFVPLQTLDAKARETIGDGDDSTPKEEEWLAEVRRHFHRVGRRGATIVLFPRHRPEHVQALASGLHRPASGGCAGRSQRGLRLGAASATPLVLRQGGFGGVLGPCLT